MRRPRRRPQPNRWAQLRSPERWRKARRVPLQRKDRAQRLQYDPRRNRNLLRPKVAAAASDDGRARAQTRSSVSRRRQP
jgi:hypothetical protein